MYFSVYVGYDFLEVKDKDKAFYYFEETKALYQPVPKISISKVHLNLMFLALQLKCHFACLPYLIYALLIVHKELNLEKFYQRSLNINDSFNQKKRNSN